MQFACPWRVPLRWLVEQQRLAMRPGLLEASLAAARSQADLRGQRVVLLEELPRLSMPVLVVWGELDQILPASQAQVAAGRLARGTAVVIPNCGHLPQVERPEEFLSALSPFLAAHAA
jgi:pimeloyl-ACP methyl ester carboxylesterase